MTCIQYDKEIRFFLLCQLRIFVAFFDFGVVLLQVEPSGCRCAGHDDTHWLGSGVHSRGFSGPSFFSGRTFPHAYLLSNRRYRHRLFVVTP
jgi:hypothetical protein